MSDKELDNTENSTTPAVRYEVGQSMNAIWAVRSMGIDPETGKEVYIKKNGDLTYDWSSEDLVVCGDLLPKVSGNFGVNSEYRGIGLNASFTWRYGGQLYNTTLLNKVENADVHYQVDRRVLTDRWTKPGDHILKTMDLILKTVQMKVKAKIARMLTKVIILIM